MAKNKTTQTTSSVDSFLQSVADEAQRNDSLRLAVVMQEQTGFTAAMWGANIIGFGTYHYKYASGREGDAPLVAFSPRANAISIYLATDFKDRAQLMEQLGKHKSGTACVYVKKLQDIDENILRKLITASVDHLQQQYPGK
jgi:hypothetical protein